uniref:Galectin n=1 Tax=Knipowitschia caucasica TaxID=637954 RepID=A0AAV2KF23_KNICA
MMARAHIHSPIFISVGATRGPWALIPDIDKALWVFFGSLCAPHLPPQLPSLHFIKSTAKAPNTEQGIHQLPAQRDDVISEGRLQGEKAVDLMCGSSVSPRADVAFHLNPRVKKKRVVCNSLVQEPQIHKVMPLRPGEAFELLILVLSHQSVCLLSIAVMLKY